MGICIDSNARWRFEELDEKRFRSFDCTKAIEWSVLGIRVKLLRELSFGV